MTLKNIKIKIVKSWREFKMKGGKRKFSELRREERSLRRLEQR